MVVGGILCCLAEGTNDMIGRGKVGISHTKVDDVNAFFLLFGFHLIDPCKKIRGEIAHAVCVHKY